MTATDLRPASVSPADVFMNLIIAFLTPMFLTTTAGDLALARAAAIETVNAYTARNQSDLLLIAQAIALGLAVLGSIGLSMAENMPINLVLRLRGNAVSLHRAAAKCRSALAEVAAPAAETQLARPGCVDVETEASVIAEVARTRQRAAEFQASLAEPATPPESSALPLGDVPDSAATMKATMKTVLADSERCIAALAEPNPVPEAPPPGMPRMTADACSRSAWSAAMAEVAAEMAAEIPRLPPAERHAASIRLAALNSATNELIDGTHRPSART